MREGAASKILATFYITPCFNLIPNVPSCLKSLCPFYILVLVV